MFGPTRDAWYLLSARRPSGAPLSAESGRSVARKEANPTMTQYSTAKAAADRFVELYGELPGQVKGIDYRALTSSRLVQGSSSDAPQQRALERMDEFSDLKTIFCRVIKSAGRRDFRLWALVNFHQLPAAEVARENDLSRSQMYRILSSVAKHVDAALLERDAVSGFGGRDLLYENGGTRPRGIQVWRNPDS